MSSSPWKRKQRSPGIDLQQETVVSLTEAAKSLPSLDGRRPHVSTIWRWCRKGLRGVRLEHGRVGHRIVTSVEALTRFSQRLAELDAKEAVSACESPPPEAPRGRTERQRQQDIERVERELLRAGIREESTRREREGTSGCASGGTKP